MQYKCLEREREGERERERESILHRGKKLGQKVTKVEAFGFEQRQRFECLKRRGRKNIRQHLPENKH